MKNVGTRLEVLREKLSLNWGELAEHLSLSRAMLDFLRSGYRDASPKTLRRLIEAERMAGLLPAETAPAEPERPAARVPEAEEIKTVDRLYSAQELSAILRAEIEAGNKVMLERIRELQEEVTQFTIKLEALEKKNKQQKG